METLLFRDFFQLSMAYFQSLLGNLRLFKKKKTNSLLFQCMSLTLVAYVAIHCALSNVTPASLSITHLPLLKMTNHIYTHYHIDTINKISANVTLTFNDILPVPNFAYIFYSTHSFYFIHSHSVLLTL